MKTPFFYLLSVLTFLSPIGAEDIKGFWRTLNEKTKKTDSIVAIYEYQGKRYGRIIATYDEKGHLDGTLLHPVDRAPLIVGQPYYAGLDILWNLQDEGKGDKYKGKIIDPEKGKIYDAELWIKDGHLIMRGEIFIFGRNETWPPATDADFTAESPKPDVSKFVPVIPEIAHKTSKK